jgi:HTH-type transcriptional regulator, sugar sensing transcriptional regulator
MLENIMQNIGLTTKEARIYLAALEIGSNPVSIIAKKAKINRVTAYDIIEKLAKRGLMTSFTRAKVKYYTAADPELVVEDFKKKVTDLDGALPQLKHLKGEVKKTAVMSYEGIEAIKNIYKEALSTNQEILMYSNIAELESHWPSFMEDFERRRMNYEIPLKLIAAKNSRGHFMQEYDDEFQRKTCLISKEPHAVESHIILFDHKVAMISTQSSVGVVIEDEAIASAQRALFHINWEMLSNTAEPAMVVRKVGNIKPQAEPEVREDQESLF